MAPHPRAPTCPSFGWEVIGWVAVEAFYREPQEITPELVLAELYDRSNAEDRRDSTQSA